MKVDSYKCDGCGVQKQEANHWFKASKVKQDEKPAGILIGQWDTRFHIPNIPATQATKNFFDAEPPAHLCGAACVSKWVSENLL